MLAERPVVGFDQLGLPHGSDGLQLGQTGGTLLQSQSADSCSDGPGADQDGLAT